MGVSVKGWGAAEPIAAPIRAAVIGAGLGP
jgi:hypothetical protein